VPGLLCDRGEGNEVRRVVWLHSEASGCVLTDNLILGSLFVLAQKKGKRLDRASQIVQPVIFAQKRPHD